MNKRIILKQITLSNWRSLNLSVVFNEDTTRISAANGKGKSSLMKAFYWALTGYPSPTETLNYNLFSNLEELSPESPKASVKIILNIDGYDYSIEKTAEAKFTRKRGSSEMTKDSSDVYCVYLDNIQMSASDYKQWLESNIAPVNMLPYCLDGGFFVSLLEDDKNKCRKVLEQIIGEIKEEDMKGDYGILKEDMLRLSVDQIEERAKNELKPYKRRQEEIPAIIEDKEKTLAEYKTIDFESILKDIEKTKGEIADLDDAILGKGKEIEPIMGERNRVLALINDKAEGLYVARRQHNDKESSKANEIARELKEARNYNATAQRITEARKEEWVFHCAILEELKKDVEPKKKERERLLKERDEIKARVFVAEKCIYCGQDLPLDEVEKMRTTFNEKKKAEYESVVARGKSIKEQIEWNETEMKRVQKIVDKGYKVEELTDTKELEVALANARSEFTPFENTEEYARLTAEIEELKKTLPEVPENDTTALTGAKKVLMETLEGLNRRYGLKAKMDEISRSINELRAELFDVGVAVARLEGKIDKCKEYRQEKAEIVSYRVNNRLVETKVEMWSTLKSGELVPDVILRGKDGIKYPSLNASNQIKTRLELQEMFLDAFGIENFPMFVDEARIFDSENMPRPSKQVIYLYASDSPYLVVE